MLWTTHPKWVNCQTVDWSLHDNGDGTLRESINEDEVVQISTEQLLAGFLDPDSVFEGLDPTAGLRIAGLPTSPNGVITQESDLFTFTPDLNFNGSTQVSFTITDGVNEIEAVKFISVDAVNDAPTIQLASASSYATSAAETMTSFSVSAGIERFFSISDFGYQDVEGNPLDSISIELPSSSIGTLYLGSGDYNTDGIDLALTEGLNNDGTAARVSRTDIEAGKLYFLAAQTAIGKSVTLNLMYLTVISIQRSPACLSSM